MLFPLLNDLAARYRRRSRGAWVGAVGAVGGAVGHAVAVADDPVPPPLTTARLLARGLTKRCPLCGGRGLFQGWFTMRERCPRCAFPLERIEGHWMGALGMNTIVSFGALFVTIVVGFAVTYPDTPTALLTAVAIGVTIVVPLLFFPFSKTLWSAVDLAMRPLEPDDDVDPRWIPAAHHHEG